MIAALEVRIVIPGHGDVFTEVTPALDRAFRRATALEADDARVARHALKALLTFCLLDQKRLLFQYFQLHLLVLNLQYFQWTQSDQILLLIL